jgi:hypothetical protein
MINLLRKWLQKLKHKPQLLGEKSQKYHDQESTQRQKSQTQNHQRTTERSTKDKDVELTYEQVFSSIPDEYLAVHYKFDYLRTLCTILNIEVQAHNEDVNRKKS